MWPRFLYVDLCWKAGSVIGVVLLIFSLKFLKSKGDPYGLFHIPLNVLPGDDSKVRPKTEWLNMGYWKDTNVFPRACEALFFEVIKNANCVFRGRVLDVGHACGDSLLMHLRHPDIPRPISITGITSIPSQHARSLDRVAEYTSSSLAEPCEVRLFCGDAIFRSQDTNHPLNPSSSTPPFTSIIALDCAYHFISREIFLRQSFARLAPGGTIALGDLAVSRLPPFIIRNMLSKLLSVRSENMVTPAQYAEQLEAIGYTNICVEDVSINVFPGFRTFLRSKGGLWRMMDLVIASYVATGGLFLIVSASKPNEM